MKLNNNNFMTHKELVEKVSASLFRKSYTLESHKSWLAIRNYLQELSKEELKELLKDSARELKNY